MASFFSLTHVVSDQQLTLTLLQLTLTVEILNISRMMQQTKDYYNSIQPVLLLPYGFRILVCFGIIPHFPLLIYLTNFCTWPAYSLMVLKDVKHSPRHLSTTTRGNQTQRFSRMIMTTLTIKILDKLWSLATHSSLLDIGIVFVKFIIRTFQRLNLTPFKGIIPNSNNIHHRKSSNLTLFSIRV